MATVRDLSSPELVAECIYDLMRRGALTKDEFSRRMSSLDRTPETALGSAYCTWLLLRPQPECAEKEFHMEVLKARMREIARHQEQKARDEPKET